MEVGLGYQVTAESRPVFFSDADAIQVSSIEEALSLSVLDGLDKYPLTQIQEELVKQGWSRIACNTVSEYFILLS